MKNPSLSKNAALNVLSHISTLAFPLITYPYASRVLGLQAMGRYNYAESIVGFLTLVAMLGISVYAVREGVRYRDDPEKLARFASEVFSINLYATILTAILLLLMTTLVSRLGGYTLLLWLLSLRILFTVIGLSWVFRIFEDFTFPALMTVIFQVLSILLLFLFVHKPTDLYAYILVTNLATNGCGIVLFFYARKYIPLRFIPFPSSRHLRPIFFIFFMEIGTVIFVRSDVFLLGWMVGDEATGLYGLAAQIYRLVKTILYALITAVIPRFAYHVRRMEREDLSSEEVLLAKQNAKKTGSYLLHILMTFCLPAMIGLFVLSEPIVRVFAGKDFAAAGRPLSILAVALLFAVLESFYADCVLIAYRKEKTVMIATFCSAAVNVILNLFFIPRYAENAAAVTTCIAEIMMLGICYLSARKLIHLQVKRRILASSLLGSAAVALLCLLVSRLVASPFIRLLSAIPLSVLLYFGIQLILKNPIVLQWRSLLPSRSRS